MASRNIEDCVKPLQDVWAKGKQAFLEKYPDLPQPILTATYRSNEEQLALYNQPFDHIDNNGNGKIDEPGERVTYAKPGQSLHNSYPSRAFDVAFKTLSGNTDWSVDLFIKFAQVIHTIDPMVVWGGSWGRIADKPHFEYRA